MRRRSDREHRPQPDQQARTADSVADLGVTGSSRETRTEVPVSVSGHVVDELLGERDLVRVRTVVGLLRLRRWGGGWLPEQLQRGRRAARNRTKLKVMTNAG